MPAYRSFRAASLFLLVLLALPAWAGNLPVGTEMIIRLETDVVPGNKEAEHFSALLSFPVFVDERQVLPAGTRIEGEVRGSKKKVMLSPRYLRLPNGERLKFNAGIRDIERERLRAEEKEGTIEAEGSKADAARQAAEVGLTGGMIGAMGTGTAKGMGIGAAIGVAAVLIGRKIAGGGDEALIPAGTQLRIALSRPLEVPDDAAFAAPSEDRLPPQDRRPILQRRD